MRLFKKAPSTPGEELSEADLARGRWLQFWLTAMLLVLVAVWVAMHVWRPVGLLSPEVAALATIDDAQSLLAASAEDSLQRGAREALASLAGRLRVLAPSLGQSQMISGTLATIDEELSQEVASRQFLTPLFNQLEDTIRLDRASFFWPAAPDRWIEAAFWGMFGTLAFLLSEIKRYCSLPYAAQPGKGKRNFRLFTPWYLVHVVRGPFIALIVLLALSSISLEIVGLTLDLKVAPVEATVVLAFVLGFYSREAEKQLDIIVEKLLGEAWRRAGRTRRSLAIEQGNVTLKPGESKTFTVKPDQEVRWFLEGPGKLEDGKYSAPEEIGDEVEAKVLAIARDEPASMAEVNVTIVPPSLEDGGTAQPASATVEGTAQLTPVPVAAPIQSPAPGAGEEGQPAAVAARVHSDGHGKGNGHGHKRDNRKRRNRKKGVRQGRASTG